MYLQKYSRITQSLIPSTALGEKLSYQSPHKWGNGELQRFLTHCVADYWQLAIKVLSLDLEECLSYLGFNEWDSKKKITRKSRLDFFTTSQCWLKAPPGCWIPLSNKVRCMLGAKFFPYMVFLIDCECIMLLISNTNLYDGTPASMGRWIVLIRNDNDKINKFTSLMEGGYICQFFHSRTNSARLPS